MSKEKYNWWTDPKNKEYIDKLSWWSHEENKQMIPFPVSIKNDGNVWVATCNDETKKLLGENLYGCAQGKTKEEAIQKMFILIKMAHDYSEGCRLSYQRWVPFRKGDWKHTGGKWLIIFGIQVYFRYGNGMKGGWYVPFTKLNIYFSNEWIAYKKYKQLIK